MSGLDTALALIFGGCCSNVFTLEAIVKHEPNTGLLITVVQFLLTSLFALPSQLRRPSRKPTPTNTTSPTTLTSPSIPLPRLAHLALLFFTVNMLNNYAFAFNISVPMHIILRSFGSVQTMAVGWMMGKRYNRVQVAGVLMLTVGVVGAAWADAGRKGKKIDISISSSSTAEGGATSSSSYATGLLILFLAQLISAYMGVLTESTYSTYGRHWGEVLFYSHFFGFLFSLALFPTLLTQWRRLMSSFPPAPPHSTAHTNATTTQFPLTLTRITSSPTTLLLLNALTQIACISGVNALSSSTTAVTVTVVLNIRKLVSFLLSCVVFGNKVDGMMAVGAGLVFLGGGVYGWGSSRGKKKKVAEKDNKVGGVNGEGMGKEDGRSTALASNGGAGDGGLGMPKRRN